MSIKPVNPSKIKSVKPISPDKVSSKKVFPDEVIQGFNTLIIKEWDGSEAVVRQCDVVEEIMKNFKESKNPMTRDRLFDEHLMDVEDFFRKAGWIVDYDKPAYCETYEATFTFKKRTMRRILKEVLDSFDGLDVSED